jgi:hypothetical protein
LYDLLFAPPREADGAALDLPIRGIFGAHPGVCFSPASGRIANISQPRLGPAAEISLLEPKPRYCEIDACDHCHWRNDTQTPYPEPAQAIWQKRGNQADYESSDRGRRSPSVPIHLGREEIQDGIGNIPGTMRAEKDYAL